MILPTWVTISTSPEGTVTSWHRPAALAGVNCVCVRRETSYSHPAKHLKQAVKPHTALSSSEKRRIKQSAFLCHQPCISVLLNAGKLSSFLSVAFAPFSAVALAYQ